MLVVTSSIDRGRDGRDRLVIRIEGDVSMSTLPRVVDGLNRELSLSDAPVVLVDLDAIGAIDDAGLGILLGFAARARGVGRVVGVVASSQRVRDRLTDSRFDRAVDVYGSLVDAGRVAK